ncbi:hypothetical protein GCM10023170_065200 [Phytohabitans houttuyneae]|uniref:Uncharacterized protein n=1 Tax=Phytohabitans houttuyneae TaxID=1076126 RepID=A0A6V8KHA7_9ACTN|nr:hypothetical protein Phou_060310 [Phytohabitans houttuyneae]
MRGVHLQPLPKPFRLQRSWLVQGERVSGLLTPTVFHLVVKSRSGFEAVNDALKRRAETRIAPSR